MTLSALFGGSTATTTDDALASRVADLNARVLAGDILGAFDEHYHRDVVMSEVGGDLRVGKPECRAFEVDFVNGIKAFRGAEVLSTAVTQAKDGPNGPSGTAMTEWFMDFDHAAWGDGVELRQVAVQQWQDGQVIRETFYHA